MISSPHKSLCLFLFFILLLTIWHRNTELVATLPSNEQHPFSVSDSYFTSNFAIGGSGGGPFYFGVDQGKPPTSGTIVRSIKAWYWNGKGNRMARIEVELTDGRKQAFGKYTGNHETDKLVISPGEKITSLKLWYSNFDKIGRSGGFQLSVNQKQLDISAGRTDGPYEPELGSGILVGVFGAAGYDLDSLGFALLREAKAQLINVTYPDLNSLIVTTSPKTLKVISYDNSNGTTDEEFVFSESESVTTSSSWSMTAGMEAGMETEVTAGIPGIASASVKVSVKESISGTYKRSTTKTTEQSFSFPFKVPAGQRLKATAMIYEGSINTRYTGTMVYTLDTGKKFSYDVSGTYTGISVSEVVVSVERF